MTTRFANERRINVRACAEQRPHHSHTHTRTISNTVPSQCCPATAWIMYPTRTYIQSPSCHTNMPFSSHKTTIIIIIDGNRAVASYFPHHSNEPHRNHFWILDLIQLSSKVNIKPAFSRKSDCDSGECPLCVRERRLIFVFDWSYCVCVRAWFLYYSDQIWYLCLVNDLTPSRTILFVPNL